MFSEFGPLASDDVCRQLTADALSWDTSRRGPLNGGGRRTQSRAGGGGGGHNEQVGWDSRYFKAKQYRVFSAGSSREAGQRPARSSAPGLATRQLFSVSAR